MWAQAPSFALPMHIQAAVTLLILLLALYSFVRELLRPDVTSLLALLALLLTGVLTPGEAFAGFGHAATVSVCAMLVLTAGLERTGALSWLARSVIAPLGRSEFLLTGVLMLVTGVLSAFVANTAAVAVFIPIVLEVCRRSSLAPSRVLMPMAHAATFGGMCTLIGTSTNLAAHEYARSQGLSGFGMFELARVGLPLAVVSITYMLFIGRLFLPRTTGGTPGAPEREPVAYESELVVGDDSRWVDTDVRADRVRRDFEVELLSIKRGDTRIEFGKEPQRLLEGDRLRVRGTLTHVLELAARHHLEMRRPAARLDSAAVDPADTAALAELAGTSLPDSSGATGAQFMTELVVLPNSPFLGRTLKDTRFAQRHDAAVLALHRPGETVDVPPGVTPLRTGDVLVVEGTADALHALARTRGFMIVGAPKRPEPRVGKLGIALLTLAGVVLIVSLGWLPIVTAATAGCAVLAITRCLEPREAYGAIDLGIVFVLAGALAMGTALEKTGLTGALAEQLANLPGIAGTWALLAGFFLVAVLLSEVMSNSGTVLLLGPIAVSAARQTGMNPMALLAAVTFGASAAFALPIGYQTSLMIYGPGGYRFRDFLRMGIVLDVLVAVVALWLIPRHWPMVLP